MSIAELYQDLDADLAGDEPDFDSEPLAPEHAEAADRMLRHLRRLAAELDSVREVADAERQRIDDWAQRQEARIVQQAAWFERSLAAWHAGLLERSPKEKTVNLPNGTLKARAQQPEWTFDEAAFLDWATEHAPDLVRHKPAPDPEVDKAAAKKALVVEHTDSGVVVRTADGEAVPGVDVTDRPPKFTVEVAP